MKLGNSILKYLLLAVFMILISGVFVSCTQTQQPIQRAPLMENHHPSTSGMWSLEDIYIDPDKHTPLIAAQGKLMFVGSDTPDMPPRLIALDVTTGNKVWQYGNNNETTLAISQTMVFVGEVGSVTALNLTSGKKVWSTSLPSRSVLKLLYRENILYVDTIGGGFFILDAETGKVIQSMDYTIDGISNKEIPDWSDHKKDLQFAGNIMYFQKQTGYPDYEGELIALDEISGNEVWNSGDIFAASRSVASPLGIFVLNLDGELLKFSPTDGGKKTIIKFTPAPLLRDELGGWNYGYYVSVDVDHHLLFVYMGDSAQLFAFQASD